MYQKSMNHMGDRFQDGLGPDLKPKTNPVIIDSQFLEPKINHVFFGPCFETDPIFSVRFQGLTENLFFLFIFQFHFVLAK